MPTPKIFESEYRFCLILWENEPIKSTELARLCKQKLDWSKTTTYTVIKRLSDRGVVKNEERTGIEEHCHLRTSSLSWCGNLYRISGSLSSYRPFFCAVFWNSSTRGGTSIRGIATKVVRYFIAMTGNSIPCPSARQIPYLPNRRTIPSGSGWERL